MNTEIIKIQPGDGPVSEEDDAKLKAAGEILRRGGLVAFPTETVYGLGGDALNPTSSKRIYAAKGRPSDNPLIVHIYRFEDIYKITGDVPEEARRIADAFWPGPLTMILPKSDAVPYETTGGLDTVAIRMPSHPAAQKLIEYSGGYIAAPSANTSGKPSPTVAKYVVEDMMGRIDAIIDGGEVGIGLESTIIDLTVSPPQILHPGKARCGVGNGGHRCHDPAGRQWPGPQGAWDEIQTLCPQGRTHHCGRYAGTGERIYQPGSCSGSCGRREDRYYRNFPDIRQMW